MYHYDVLTTTNTLIHTENEYSKNIKIDHQLLFTKLIINPVKVYTWFQIDMVNNKCF